VDKESLGRLLLSSAYLEAIFVLRSGRRKPILSRQVPVENRSPGAAGYRERNGRAGAQSAGSRVPMIGLQRPSLACRARAGLSLELGLPLCLVRKLSKEYGTQADRGQVRAGEIHRRGGGYRDVWSAAIQAAELCAKPGWLSTDLYAWSTRGGRGRGGSPAA